MWAVFQLQKRKELGARPNPFMTLASLVMLLKYVLKHHKRQRQILVAAISLFGMGIIILIGSQLTRQKTEAVPWVDDQWVPVSPYKCICDDSTNYSGVEAGKKGQRKFNRINFVYVHPKSYHGPIVDGWPPARSRSVPQYIKGTLLFSGL